MNTPATDLPLSGHALIEASAGTGKTWTLTGILLRLVIEAGYEPRHIVATTFTRAAATEMQQRVQQRLEHFRALLIALIRGYGDNAELLAEDANLTPRALAHLDQHPDAALRDYSGDAVNRHLLEYTLAHGVDGLIRTYRRTQLALQHLDQLFIGTLDSLCQRWLRELALESGVENIRINTAPDAIAQLSHDHLRRYYQQQAQENPERFARFYSQAPGHTDHEQHNRNTLNYGDSPFLPLPPYAEDSAPSPAAQLAAFGADDIKAAQALLDRLAADKHLTNNQHPAKSRAHLPATLAALVRNTLPEDPAFLRGLQKAFAAADTGDAPFSKKTPPEARAQLTANPLLRALNAAALTLDSQHHNLHLMALHSLQDNSEYVRAHLPEALRQSGETTYGELLARLNATLAANPALCQHLAHRYPVMLVDEAQDLNHEQAQLLRRIYATEEHHGFWLLVGDPKQAIYRFRGSDVMSYTALKNDIGNTHPLTLNFRSSPALIDTLNTCYQAAPANADLGENIAYQAVQAAKPERPIVMRNGQPIAAPLHWFSIDKADDEPAAIVALIRHLTGAHSRWLRRGENGLQPLRPSDILILARSNSALQTLEHALAHAGISSAREADQSLFTQSVAAEMRWLLAALIEPGNNAIIRRLLAGKFYGFDLAALERIAGSDTLARFHQQLARARERWNRSGLLAALQHLWREDPWGEDGDNIWTRLAAQAEPDCWRDLLDLRRLQEIIAANEQAPHRFLDWWQQQLARPPVAEWALCLPLPGNDAVRLMTIHKAKGLQAPVVILAGMSNARNTDDYAVRPFHRDGQLWLATGKHNDAADAQIGQENAAEMRRLLYVALTRAEDLLFIASRKTPFLPLKTLQESAHIQPDTLDTLLVPDDSPVHWAPAPAVHTPVINTPLPAPALRGWRKTSFSALARDIPAAAHDLAVYDTLDLELGHETDLPAPAAVTAAFAHTFPRGPQAGSFLHEALEKIRLPRRAHWPHFFRTLIAKHHLPALNDHLVELEHWFAAILTSPLTSGATLAQLTDSGKAERELGFSLALDACHPLPTQALRAHFARWGKTLPLPDSPALYRYLRGEIDLVYEHQGRYHIVDYKSNHLGTRVEDYDNAAMTRAMDDHHYWLQAALYQLALHRLLSVRLPGYHPTQHLAPVEYYFLRAAGGEHAYGHLAIDIPSDWLLQLDHLFLSK